MCIKKYGTKRGDVQLLPGMCLMFVVDQTLRKFYSIIWPFVIDCN